jgi:hypothetical protein
MIKMHMKEWKEISVRGHFQILISSFTHSGLLFKIRLLHLYNYTTNCVTSINIKLSQHVGMAHHISLLKNNSPHHISLLEK